MTYRQRMAAQDSQRKDLASRESLDKLSRELIAGMDDFYCYMEGFDLGKDEKKDGVDKPMESCVIADSYPYPAEFRRGYYNGFGS